MEHIKILREFHPRIEKDMVFRQIQCFPDSPVYEEIEDTYRDIETEMLKLCEPAGVMALGKIPAGYFHQEREAIYVLVTIGPKLSSLSTRKFAEGDYVQGMLIDAVADSILFSLEADIIRELRRTCLAWKKGISRRLEAPHDISMQIQAEAFKQTNAGELLGLGLSDGYMFQPIKTSCQIYLTSDDEHQFQAQHNCRKCPNVDCLLRHVEPLKIRIVNDEEKETIISLTDGTLLEAIQAQADMIPSPCGGLGICGKCRIQVLDGYLPITSKDQEIFTDNELAAGWRLACRAVPDEDLTIRLKWKNEAAISVQTDFYKDSKILLTDIPGDRKELYGQYGFAIDIGTTTLAVQLISLETGTCIDTGTRLNSQRLHGADVITRIQASIDGRHEELMEMIHRDLWQSMETLRKKHDISIKDIKRIAIAGNTVMIHLLMGYPCNGLGQVPFTPYRIDGLQISAKELFPESDARTDVLIYPGISTFVGADIVSGLCALHMAEEEPIRLLVDLGTNGEMVLGNKDELLAASAAAGPAFEGGNITWGTGSVPGAISKVHLEGKKLDIQTIQGKDPMGICGTGAIELAAELARNAEMDETGRLKDPWFESGFPVALDPRGEQICLTQKDIREIQLAKAAVRGGIEVLLANYGITAEQVDLVYVAGGFGYQLDYEKAIRIGLFPAAFSEKIKTVGNSSLRGAAELLCNPENMQEAAKTAALAKEISLSADPVFQEAYMDAMFFEE